jgi:hypothetical protein
VASGLAYCGTELITAVKRFWVQPDVFCNAGPRPRPGAKRVW